MMLVTVIVSVLIATLGLAIAGAAVVAGRAIFHKGKAPGDDPKPQEEFDPFQTGSRMERRVCARRQGNPIEILIGDSKGENTVGKAWVVDRSMGGLCLMSPAPIEAGQILTVKPSGSSGAPVFWLQVEIRSCRPNGSDFEVGCRFVKAPTWNQLLYYG